MPDLTEWIIPVEIIAKDHAKVYADHFDSFEESLKDTLDLFTSDPFEVEDWSRNNMDWDDVKEYAIQLPYIPNPDLYQTGWANGEIEVVELEI